MNIKYAFKISFVALKTNKSRSILTILGIVIGITAILIVTSLGRGAQDLILGQIQGMGSKTIIILPGRQPAGTSEASMSSMMETMFGDSLRERDIEALKKKSNVPTLARIMPIVFGSAGAVYESETYRMTIFGVDDLVIKLYDLSVAEGAFFSEDDVRTKADVVVIGSKIKEELFGSSEALGQRIKMKGRNFRVVGILAKKGSGSLVNFDDTAFVPYTTAQQYLFGIKYYHRVVLEADLEQNVDRTVKDVETTLRDLHNITDSNKDDFHLETQAGLMDTVGTITSILTIFLAAVAAISLVVGGVGIMNIMLVSVTERTREIGLRKALGATKRDILSQFLFEAMALTAAGGIIGIILGASISFLVSLALSSKLGVNWAFTFPFSATLLGLGVSTAVGFFFGLYPARQASRKNPIEALRYE